MQVNTIWVKPKASLAHMNQNAVIERLVDDPCFNIAAAAAVMRLYLNEAHGNLMTAIGYYHSHTSALGATYRDKGIAAAEALFIRRRRR